MSFIDYIKGNRSGEDAHGIEKESMRDPFMYEAIEGFDSIQDNHMERIGGIEKRLRFKKKSPRGVKKLQKMWQITAAAAAAVIIFAVAGYLYNIDYKKNLYSENLNIDETEEIIKIYVPEEYYTENITIIAKYNANSIKSHNLEKRSKIKIEAIKTVTKLPTESIEVIDIYIPE